MLAIKELSQRRRLKGMYSMDTSKSNFSTLSGDAEVDNYLYFKGQL